MAILNASAVEQRDWRASLASRSAFSIQASPYLLGDLGDVDGRFEGFDLAEEEPASRGRGRVQYSSRRRWWAGDADIAAPAPEGDALADPVDELVLLDAVLRPFGVEGELLAPFFLRAWAMGMK